MRCAKMAAWIILGGLTCVLPWTSVALDSQSGQPRRQGIKSQNEPSAAAEMPEYIPPGAARRGVVWELARAGLACRPRCFRSHQTIPA